MPQSRGTGAIRLDTDQVQQLAANSYQLEATNFAVGQLLVELLHSFRNQEHCMRIYGELLSIAKTMNALIRHRNQIISGAAQCRADRIIINVTRNQIREFATDDDERPSTRVKPETPEVIKSDHNRGVQLKSLFFLTNRAAIEMRTRSFWTPTVLHAQIERLAKVNAALFRQHRHLEEERAESATIEIRIDGEAIGDEPVGEEFAEAIV